MWAEDCIYEFFVLVLSCVFWFIMAGFVFGELLCVSCLLLLASQIWLNFLLTVKLIILLNST